MPRSCPAQEWTFEVTLAKKVVHFRKMEIRGWTGVPLPCAAADPTDMLESGLRLLGKTRWRRLDPYPDFEMDRETRSECGGPDLHIAVERRP